MLVFVEGGKPEDPDEVPGPRSEREPQRWEASTLAIGNRNLIYCAIMAVIYKTFVWVGKASWNGRAEDCRHLVCGDITILCCSNLRMFSRCHRNYCWCGGWISCHTSCCCWNSCFFRWKSRRRRSKKSNGKSCITDNTGSHEMYRGIRQLMVRAACVFI